MKTCSKCGKEKPMEQFSQSRLKKDGTRGGDGRRKICKACTNAEKKKSMAIWSSSRMEAYKKKGRQDSRQWAKKHPLAVKAHKANLHAKRVCARGKVTADDVESVWSHYDGKCWVCGFAATELDHYRPINRSGGGVNAADNIRPICRECNQKRSHLWHGSEIAEKEAHLLRQLKCLLNAKQNGGSVE